MMLLLRYDAGTLSRWSFGGGGGGNDASLGCDLVCCVGNGLSGRGTGPIKESDDELRERVRA